MDATTRSRASAGVLLILLGLGLYFMQYLENTGEAVTLCLLGGLFVAGYFFSTSVLLLVPGCILCGLGAAAFGERTFYIFGEWSQLGAGFGCLAIWLVGLAYEQRSRLWPIIPGVILILLGFNAWGKAWRFLFSAPGWPILLAILGALILVGIVGRQRRKTAT